MGALSCAQGYPADGGETSPLVPQGPTSNVTGSPGVPMSGGAGSSAQAVSTAAGAPSTASPAANVAANCQNLDCSEVWDCVLKHFGNTCGFTKCEAGVCR
jgi:hypothetical protein